MATIKASVDDPDCTGENPFMLTEMVFVSQDGGQTFDSGTNLADLTGVNTVDLGPGKPMVNFVYPSIAVGPNGNVYVAWNDSDPAEQDGDFFGPTHIRLATSTDGGEHWDLQWLTTGGNDTIQPALSADTEGVHVLYYFRNDNATLDVIAANSADASAWTTRRVSSQSFPGALTAPGFDPQIGWGFAGNYLANATDWRTQYFAWGDNRNSVKDFMYPAGRNDPNVYFAKQ